ncbi:MAG: 4-hydroxythreonine-4-phosphate dehydrogenase PdxA [Anaerolineae bacterium]
MIPRIGITMGDPAGVGSEITAKMLVGGEIRQICIPIVIGDARVIRQGFAIIGAVPDFEVIYDLDHPLEPDKNYVYDLGNIDVTDYTFGQISAAAGRAAGEAIETAVKLAMAGQIDAIVTNPIHKESFYLSGYGAKYPGHTEMLAALTGTKSYCMMLVSGNLRICHVTTHVSLLDALTRYITPERILEVIRLADRAAKRLGLPEPLIGVAAINPHAGEQGLFGDEEQRLILPAIEQASAEGIRVEGPVPADTLFSKAKGGWYAIVVAMYHDQGHIPCKLEGFLYDHTTGKWIMTGVNVTLGLPIIRTSVDHGTAFGKAGKGKADPLSLIQATRLAVDLATGGTA